MTTFSFNASIFHLTSMTRPHQDYSTSTMNVVICKSRFLLRSRKCYFLTIPKSRIKLYQSATQVSFLTDQNLPFFGPSKTVALPVMPKTICKARTGDRLGITTQCAGKGVPNQSKKIAHEPMRGGVSLQCPSLQAPSYKNPILV